MYDTSMEPRVVDGMRLRHKVTGIRNRSAAVLIARGFRNDGRAALVVPVRGADGRRTYEVSYS